MEDIFGSMVDDYLANQIGISENFLSKDLCADLATNVKTLYNEDKLEKAKIGKTRDLTLNTEIRNDKIFWLDRLHNNAAENAFLTILDKFTLYLNQTCYTGITSSEFHYALYEKGSFYKKHLDQFNGSSSRQYTLIFYLNENWKAGDGGELCIYVNNEAIHISPTNGKSLFFKSSQLEHEVLPCNTNRMSITGWLKTD